MTESTEQTTPTNGGGLASLKLAQLQALASQLGIAGGSRMRKADLVTAISDHQRGGSVADRDAAERPARRRSRRADADTSAPAAAAQDGQPQAEAREDQTEQAPRETASDQDRSGGSEARDEGEDRPQSERLSLIHI